MEEEEEEGEEAAGGEEEGEEEEEGLPEMEVCFSQCGLSWRLWEMTRETALERRTEKSLASLFARLWS